MKKIGMWAAVGAVMIGLAGCGGKGGTGASQGQPEESGAQTSGEESQSGAENGGAGSGQDPANPGLGWSDEMETLRSAVEDALGENYWPNAKIDEDTLESTYGIAPDMYEDYLGEVPAISVNVDTLLVIKAVEDTSDEVEDVLTEYRENLIENSMQYPMNLGKIQASRIERMGDYVFYVQLGGDTLAAADMGDEEVIRHCQEQNELAIAVIERQLVR